MKKLLPVATLLALATSGMASAAFTDAEAGAWSNNLEFNGTITNTNPIWKYQIPEVTVEDAQNWSASRESGVIDGNNTNFAFTDKYLVVLQGVMSDVLPESTIGLHPVITFGSGDMTITWDTTAPPVNNQFIQIKTADNNGILTGIISGNVAIQKIEKSSGNRNSDSNYLPESHEALALLKQQPYYNPTYDGVPEDHLTNNNSTIHLSHFDYYNMSAALEASMYHFSLSYPTASIPETWAATLPISITHK